MALVKAFLAVFVVVAWLLSSAHAQDFCLGWAPDLQSCDEVCSFGEDGGIRGNCSDPSTDAAFRNVAVTLPTAAKSLHMAAAPPTAAMSLDKAVAPSAVATSPGLPATPPPPSFACYCCCIEG